MISDIIDGINHDFNYEHKIKLYDEVPKNITRDMVHEENIKKEFINQKVEDKHSFELGETVKVVLKNKKKLEKSRIQKWSDGDYIIIDKQNNFYLVSPAVFDIDEYKKEYEIP